MEVEYEGNTFIPARIAYLPNTLDNVQVESKLARHAATYTVYKGTLYVYVFHPFLRPSSQKLFTLLVKVYLHGQNET